jgi:branched-chain amino acid aminotransferase
MAARYAQGNKLDDALVLNSFNNIAETSIANIFLVKGKQLLTPALEEGCVGGVVRRWILERYAVTECPVQLEDILAADEVFLTNAIYGVRWVAQFRNITYGHLQASAIHRELRNAT